MEERLDEFTDKVQISCVTQERISCIELDGGSGIDPLPFLILSEGEGDDIKDAAPATDREQDELIVMQLVEDVVDDFGHVLDREFHHLSTWERFHITPRNSEVSARRGVIHSQECVILVFWLTFDPVLCQQLVDLVDFDELHLQSLRVAV